MLWFFYEKAIRHLHREQDVSPVVKMQVLFFVLQRARVGLLTPVPGSCQCRPLEAVGNGIPRPTHVDLAWSQLCCGRCGHLENEPAGGNSLSFSVSLT